MPRLFLIPVPQAWQDLCNQPCGEEGLVDGIMQVARQALSFLQDCKCLCLSIEFHIDQGDGGLVGYAESQIRVMRREVILVFMCHTYASDHATFDCQRYPHPRLHPFEQSSSSIIQKRTQELRLRIVVSHIGDS